MSPLVLRTRADGADLKKAACSIEQASWNDLGYLNYTRAHYELYAQLLEDFADFQMCLVDEERGDHHRTHPEEDDLGSHGNSRRPRRGESRPGAAQTAIVALRGGLGRNPGRGPDAEARIQDPTLDRGGARWT